MIVSEHAGVNENCKPRSWVESAQIGLSQTIGGQGLLINSQPRFRHGAQACIRRFHAAQSHLLQQLDERIGLRDAEIARCTACSSGVTIGYSVHRASTGTAGITATAAGAGTA